MKIIVCLKQVPESQNVRLDPVTHNLQREGVASIINPFDLYALEEGLRVRQQQGGEVIVLSMGPPQAEAALREALTYGADRAVLLSDRPSPAPIPGPRLIPWPPASAVWAGLI